MPAPSDLEGSVAFRRKPVSASGLKLLLLSFQTLGIIYSDIGTSPLYVLNGIWPSSGPLPSSEDVIGGVSAILWSLILIPLIKYVFICLHFGTGEGEGGTFALFQGLYPPPASDQDADRVLTGDSAYRQRSFSTPGHLSETLKWPLLLWCLLGTSLTMADGMLTPAVSVTSAVGGIATVKPSVTKDITAISIAFLVGLFVVQPLGTSRIAKAFAPVTFVWLLLLGGTGIANISKYPGIFRAFDPSRAVMLFVRTGQYDLLGGILLAVTGCEALFANLGQFTMLSIQISFGAFTFPCLVLAYLGQGARLIVDKEAVFTNLFYQTIPGPPNGALFWIVYVFGILATLIASQAMITATFSLVQQIVNTKGLPPLRMIYTSETIQGQVFIPICNWILMISTIVLVAAFQNSTNLTNAYGFAVATVMFTTSVMISIQMLHVKRLPMIVAFAFFVFYGFIDGLFWGASIKKVPQGAWVPLVVGVILLLLMAFWTWAKGLEDKFDGLNRRNLRHFIVTEDDGQITLRSSNAQKDSDADDINQTETKEQMYYYVTHDATQSVDEEKDTVRKRKLIRIPTCALFYKFGAGKGVPHSFVGLIRHWPALPRVVIFLSVSVLPMARVPQEHRYSVNKVRSIEGFYGVTYYIGFREDADPKIEEIVEKICALESRGDAHELDETLCAIKDAASNATHIVPHYHVLSRKVDVGKLSGIVNWLRKFLIEQLYRPTAAMFQDTVNWNGPPDSMIRVGINASI